MIFNIKTTDLSRDAQVVQLAACLLSDSNKSFDKYMLPTIVISERASAVTGITTQLVSGHKVLCHNGEKIDALP